MKVKKIAFVFTIFFNIVLWQKYSFSDVIIFSLVPYSLLMVHLLIILVILIEAILLFKLLTPSWKRAILASFTVNICSALIGFYLIGAYNYSLEGKAKFGKTDFMNGTLMDLALFLPAWLITIIIEFLLLLKFFYKGCKGKEVLMTSIKVNTISYAFLMIYYTACILLV